MQVIEGMRRAAPGRRIRPPHVGASHSNRGGLLTNGHVVHGEISFAIKKDGHDLGRTKLAPGIHYTNLAKLEKLLVHKRKIKTSALRLMLDVLNEMNFVLGGRPITTLGSDTREPSW